MSSKRKKRDKEFLERVEKRRKRKQDAKLFEERINSGDIYKIANALGVRIT